MECPDICTTLCGCCYTNGECCGCLRNIGGKGVRQKYPNIEYYSPEVANGAVEMPEQAYRKVPLDKIFEFPQESRVFNTHPQISRRSRSLVTQQPQVMESTLDPMYITTKGRSHTFSQLPEAPEQSRTPTPEPPFTPPPMFHSHPPMFSKQPSVIQETDESLNSSEQQVKFALYFDVQRRTLIIHLQQAFNLPPQEVHRTAGTFITLFLLPSREEVHQTAVVSGVSPVFNQVFEFGGILTDEVRQQVLVLQLFYHDKFSRDHLIGTVIMPLKDVDLYGMDITKEVGEGRELLKRFATGDLLLSVRYSPERHKLQGIILKATNLPRPHKWGLADPYVKVYLLYQHKRITKWKSTIKKSTLAPVFNEAFEFDIKGLDTKDICLEVFIMDHDRFRRNDMIGLVYFGAQVPNESGSTHFTEVMANPGHPVSYWHQLIPHQQLKKRKRHKSQTL